MSDSQENRPLLDLSELRLMPKWVTDFGKTGTSTSTSPNEETEPRPQRHSREGNRDGRDRRGPRNDSRPPFQRNGAGKGQGTPRQGGGPGASQRSGGDRDRSSGGRPAFRQDRDRGGRPHNRGGRDGGDRPHFEAPPAVPADLQAEVEPEARATESMAGMIRNAGKAYSVFDAARLVLASGDRFHVKFSFPKDSKHKLYAIPADGSLWLSHEDAINHFLHSEGLNEFYRSEEVELEEPKGNFTSIAICGMTGELLGPPSHHSYQTSLHRIHRERFAHLSFEDYKRRVRTETSPEVVEKWKAAQKHGTQWVLVTHNDEPVSEVEPSPAEQAPQEASSEDSATQAEEAPTAENRVPATVFKSRAEMEAHFRKNYATNLVHETSSRYVAGNVPKNYVSPPLYHLLRRTVDEARKHLLAIAQRLCTGFEQNGLKLFKRRGGKLWVSRTRPRLLDTTVVLSERISRMVELVKANPGITTKALVEAVCPSTGTEATDKPEIAASATTQEPLATPAEGSVTTEPAATATATTAVPQHEATPEQLLALKDLHWLNSEGYVIEYADGVVFPGVTEPPPAKPKAEKKAPAKSADAETASDLTLDEESHFDAAEAVSDGETSGEETQEAVTDTEAESIVETAAEDQSTKDEASEKAPDASAVQA